MFRQVCKCGVWRAFSDHEVYCDQALEDHSPGRVAQTELKRPEDFCHTSLTGMRRNEDVLDIFRLGRRRLVVVVSAYSLADRAMRRRAGSRKSQMYTLILVAPLTDFSKELDMAETCRYNLSVLRGYKSNKILAVSASRWQMTVISVACPRLDWDGTVVGRSQAIAGKKSKEIDCGRQVGLEK